MKTIKLVFTLLFSFCVIVESFPQTLKTGTTAAQMLKFNVGPRAIGLGGAFTSIANDVSAMYWNPSGTANIQSNEVFFNHSSLFLDLRHNYAAVASTISDVGTFGAFVSVLTMDEMLVRTVERPEGTGELFSAGTIVMGVNFSKYLIENFAIGFNLKYISESIWNMNATGFAIDIGTMYKIPILNELRIASSISNFGTKMSLQGRDATIIYNSGAGGGNFVNADIEMGEFDLPLIFRFGISADIIKDETSRLTTAIDAIHPNDHTEYINSGIEYSWNESIFLRGGYNSLFEKDSEKGLTFGFGLQYRLFELTKIKIDYAFQEFGRLKNIHYFSVGMIF